MASKYLTMEDLIKRSLNEIVEANNNAMKMLDAGLEPPVHQDRLQDCLLAMLQKDMGDDTVDQFINDLYVEKLTSQEIYDRYFV